MLTPDGRTYVYEYLPRAIDAVVRETGCREVTMVGYCLGAVLALLYANAHEDARVRNLVLLATPLDFREMGPMVAALVEESRGEGLLDKRETGVARALRVTLRRGERQPAICVGAKRRIRKRRANGMRGSDLVAQRLHADLESEEIESLA